VAPKPLWGGVKKTKLKLVINTTAAAEEPPRSSTVFTDFVSKTTGLDTATAEMLTQPIIAVNERVSEAGSRVSRFTGADRFTARVTGRVTDASRQTGAFGSSVKSTKSKKVLFDSGMILSIPEEPESKPASPASVKAASSPSAEMVEKMRELEEKKRRVQEMMQKIADAKKSNHTEVKSAVSRFKNLGKLKTSVQDKKNIDEADDEWDQAEDSWFSLVHED